MDPLQAHSVRPQHGEDFAFLNNNAKQEQMVPTQSLTPQTPCLAAHLGHHHSAAPPLPANKNISPVMWGVHEHRRLID